MKSKQIGDAAERLFQKALAASASGDVVQAERLYRLAIGMVAGRSEPRHNLGALLRSLGHLEEARDLLAFVLVREPDLAETRYALGMVLMGLGDYPAGWPLYESRRDLLALKVIAPILGFPEWKGEPLAGKRIVLFPEQGLGDNIQFARFALTLRDRGAQVLMLCRPPLRSLLQQSLDGVEVLAAEGQARWASRTIGRCSAPCRDGWAAPWRQSQTPLTFVCLPAHACAMMPPVSVSPQRAIRCTRTTLGARCGSVMSNG